MAAGPTTISGSDAQSNPVTLLAVENAAGAIGFAHTLVDQNGLAVGVPANPSFHRDSTAEAKVGTGADASGSSPAALATLVSFNVTNAGCYYVQNQSAATLQVIFSDGAGGTPSTMLLAPGAGAGAQGGDTSPPMPWFIGQIIVAGPTGSQFMARHN